MKAKHGSENRSMHRQQVLKSLICQYYSLHCGGKAYGKTIAPHISDWNVQVICVDLARTVLQVLVPSRQVP